MHRQRTGRARKPVGAHLIGFSVAPPEHLIPAGMPGTPDVIVDDARRVAKVVTIRSDELGPDQDEYDLDICSSLARHNVRRNATEPIATHGDVGRTLTQQAIAHGADLLVMGCYGRSRLREFTLHMMIPVLMSH